MRGSRGRQRNQTTHPNIHITKNGVNYRVPAIQIAASMLQQFQALHERLLERIRSSGLLDDLSHGIDKAVSFFGTSSFENEIDCGCEQLLGRLQLVAILAGFRPAFTPIFRFALVGCLDYAHILRCHLNALLR